MPSKRGNIAPFPALFFKQQAEETDILPGHRTRILVVLFVGLAIVAGCGRRRTSRSGPTRQLKKSELTVAEQKYGIAPIPGPSVTYQPDVIVVGGGADAIRAESSNGFIWTIDGNAPHAAELVPGKIFFLTGRAVGRVLDVHKDGSNLVVVVWKIPLVGDVAVFIPFTCEDTFSSDGFKAEPETSNSRKQVDKPEGGRRWLGVPGAGIGHVLQKPRIKNRRVAFATLIPANLPIALAGQQRCFGKGKTCTFT